MRLQRDDKWLAEIRDLVLIKFPALGATMSKLEIVSANIPTASTDNKNIYYSKSFLESLTTGERAFILAHEIMHVEFEHIQRTLNRDKRTWNIATDAVINQLLLNAGLEMPKGVVNIPEAINKSADEVYEYLLNNASIVDDIMNGKSEKSANPGLDDHGNWEEVANNELSKEIEQDGQNGSDASKKSNQEDDNKVVKTQSGTENENSEKDFAKKNEEMKESIARNMRSSLAKDAGTSIKKETFSFEVTVKENPVVDWRRELKKELEKDEDVWSYRRANKQNYYCARQEVMTHFEKSVTEVLLDTSGSVSDNLLRSFLSQIRFLLKEGELKVACFDNFVYDFVNIKNENDISKMNLVGRGGTSFNNAIKAFSNKKEINKIIFTDGYDSVNWDCVPASKKNIIWVVYDNPDFVAKYGKVINVRSKNVLRVVDAENEMRFEESLER